MNRFIPISSLLLSVACTVQGLPRDIQQESGEIAGLCVSIAPQAGKSTALFSFRGKITAPPVNSGEACLRNS